MLQKLAAVLALLTALAGAGSAMAAEVVLADDVAVLKLFFHADDFTPEEDFFYRFVEQARDGNEPLHGKLREIRPFNGQYLFVVETRGDSHSAGYCNLAFGVYDPASGGIVGEPLRFAADWADYMLCYRDGTLSIIYIGGSIWTGLESYGGSRWTWADGEWRMVWPYDAYGEAYEDFWAFRKPEVDRESHGTLRTSWRIPAPEGESLSDYVWKREGSFDTFHPIDPKHRHQPKE